MRMTTLAQALVGIIATSPWFAFAFNSGSTGADGAFSPTVSQQIALPESGVFNFTNVNIPVGVTITFAKNQANTPVVILASGDVAIAGTVNISGTASPASGANGSPGDDGQPGNGGPGGFAGGRGGRVAALAADRVGGNGIGPGGGGGGASTRAGGGSFGTAGAVGSATCGGQYVTVPGAVYGSELLLPLIGGSGGGGGFGGTTYTASGGGGGGGALLIAASGTINLTGTLLANGGASGDNAGAGIGYAGGGGSGGAIRLVATAVTGNGAISANGGGRGTDSLDPNYCGNSSGAGRIRIEAENMTRTASTSPAYTFGVPGQLFVAGLPMLSITSVAGIAAPANPTGSADITLPVGTANPVSVTFSTTGVPAGNIIKLTVLPAYGGPVTVMSPALVGTTESATANVQVNLPAGPSTLQAQTTYTIVASLGDALSRYANNERVEKVQLSSVMGGQSTVTLITVSGKEYQVPAALLTMLPS